MMPGAEYLDKKNIYLLVGGGCHEGPGMELLRDDVKNWLSVKGIHKPKILFVQFARSEDRWVEMFEKYKKSYLSGLLEPYHTPEKIFASTDRTTFEKQIKESDVIVLSGGSEILLKERLKKMFGRRKVPFPIFGKLIISTSAGTNFLGRYYFSNMRQRTEKGYGFLPFKFVCHYTNDKIHALNELAMLDPKYPILFIREDRFRTIIM